MYMPFRLWKSLEQVRGFHNSASNRGCRAGLGRITQKGMALAQLGFIGHVMALGPKIGIHKASDEELKGFVHLWRVIGYVLGMEER